MQFYTRNNKISKFTFVFQAKLSLWVAAYKFISIIRTKSPPFKEEFSPKDK